MRGRTNRIYQQPGCGRRERDIEGVLAKRMVSYNNEGGVLGGKGKCLILAMLSLGLWQTIEHKRQKGSWRLK